MCGGGKCACTVEHACLYVRWNMCVCGGGTCLCAVEHVRVWRWNVFERDGTCAIVVVECVCAQ